MSLQRTLENIVSFQDRAQRIEADVQRKPLSEDDLKQRIKELITQETVNGAFTGVLGPTKSLWDIVLQNSPGIARRIRSRYDDHQRTVADWVDESRSGHDGFRASTHFTYRSLHELSASELLRRKFYDADDVAPPKEPSEPEYAAVWRYMQSQRKPPTDVAAKLLGIGIDGKDLRPDVISATPTSNGENAVYTVGKAGEAIMFFSSAVFARYGTERLPRRYRDVFENIQCIKREPSLDRIRVNRKKHRADMVLTHGANKPRDYLEVKVSKHMSTSSARSLNDGYESLQDGNYAAVLFGNGDVHRAKRFLEEKNWNVLTPADIKAVYGAALQTLRNESPNFFHETPIVAHDDSVLDDVVDTLSYRNHLLYTPRAKGIREWLVDFHEVNAESIFQNGLNFPQRKHIASNHASYAEDLGEDPWIAPWLIEELGNDVFVDAWYSDISARRSHVTHAAIGRIREDKFLTDVYTARNPLEEQEVLEHIHAAFSDSSRVNMWGARHTERLNRGWAVHLMRQPKHRKRYVKRLVAHTNTWCEARKDLLGKSRAVPSRPERNQVYENALSGWNNPHKKDVSTLDDVAESLSGQTHDLFKVTCAAYRDIPKSAL